MNLQIASSLIATAISFIDAVIMEVSPKGGGVQDYIDVKQLLSSALSVLRGDADADLKIENVNQRRKDRKNVK